jgi:outer membrane protein
MKIKRIILSLILVGAGALTAAAQKTAFVDLDYILANIPEYKNAQSELDKISASWQKEIEGKFSEVDKLYKSYQAEEILLTEEMKKKRQAEIVQKEKEAKDLQKQRFGVDGDLFKKRQELVKPIQDKVYNAVKALCDKEQIMIMFNKTSDLNILYSNAKFDKSDAVLESMGYKPGAK